MLETLFPNNLVTHIVEPKANSQIFYTQKEHIGISLPTFFSSFL